MAVETDFRLGAKPSAAVLDEVIPGLVWGVRCSGTTAAPIEGDFAKVEPGQWLWLHFNLADMRTPSWLASTTLISKTAAERLLSNDDTQQIVPLGDCITGVFFDLVRNLDGTINEFGYFRFALTEQVLITGRRRALSSIETARQRIEMGHRFTSPVELLIEIVSQIASTIDMTVEELATEIDMIEDTVLKEGMRDDRVRLGAARLTTVRIHRRLNSLGGLFRRLSVGQPTGLMATLRTTAGPLTQRLDELDHEVVELRDRAHLLQEELSARVAEQTNRHLHILSIVTTLLLPPTLVTGLFGMNVDGLPFAGNVHGFWWTFALAFGASAVAVWVLSKIGVFKGRRGEARRP
jgi:zinc transporter